MTRRHSRATTGALRLLSIVALSITSMTLDVLPRGRLRADEPAATDSGLWSLRPLAPPTVPEVHDSGPTGARRAANPVDAFVLARLAERGLSLAPPAARRVFIRRVTFDLTGLPPTPDEIDAFVEDSRPDDLAVADLVDRLLASPHHGERQARRFLDLIHFAETHGHDEDAIREHAWPYRDWLVRAFAEDMPWPRFIEAQVAGDVLFADDPWATVATGLLAAGPWDESSQMGIQDGTTDKAIARILDRDDMLTTVMSAFTSMTVGCARCHDHKFDPIPLEDYWSLQAVFAGVDRTDRPWEPDAEVSRARRELERDLGRLADDDAVLALLAQPASAARIAALEDGLRRAAGTWRVVRPGAVRSAAGVPSRALDDGSVLFEGETPPTDTTTFELEVADGEVAAIRLEVLPDDRLPARGPGRAVNGNLHLSEVRVRRVRHTSGATVREDVAVEAARSDFDQDGWTIAHAIDGDPDTAWGVHPRQGARHAAAFRLAEGALDDRAGDESGDGIALEVELAWLHGREHVVGRARLPVSDDPTAAVGLDLPDDVREALAAPSESRNDGARIALARYLLERDLRARLDALPAPRQVYAVTSEFEPRGNFKPANGPRPVHVLRRGDIHSPIAPARPGALSCIGGLDARFDQAPPNDEGARRAALARWLSDERNVLTWRSAANRAWQLLFGRGIVATPNDFGAAGSPPTHPELLDWLACELRESGGSLHALLRTIATSATYRQSWRHDDRALSVDPEGLLHWRAPLRRLDAESIRDATLAISGELDRRMYGPSARQFTTSPGVHVTPNAHYSTFAPESPENRRRSVWRFIFRTQPDPWFAALDCPDASTLTPARTETTTPLQALALLHHPLGVHLSERLAARLAREAPTPEARVHRLFRLALGRAPTSAEASAVVEYAERFGLANACRWVLCLNEFLHVE